MSPKRFAMLAAVAGCALAMSGAAPELALADGSGPDAMALTGTIATDLSAQSQPRRARTRIRVYPRPYSYPGPNAVRECRAWLAIKHRPSGTVAVPRMRCWWVPG